MRRSKGTNLIKEAASAEWLLQLYPAGAERGNIIFRWPSTQAVSSNFFPIMTTTTTYTGMDPSGRSSSRVLRPPGGGSNFNIGFDLPKDQQGGKRNKMASSIFGTPEENPPSWAKSTAKSTEVEDNSEVVGSERRGSSDASSGDYVIPKGVESEAPENTEETAAGSSEEKPLPAAPLPSPEAPAAGRNPSPAAPAPSRRNPPGGKSSLVLG